MENRQFYILRCPNCGRKGGMYLEEDEREELYLVNPYRDCPHCGTKVYFNKTNLYLGKKEDIFKNV